MLATMIPAAFASDLDGHWSKNFIEYLDDEGIINPSATTGKYEPERKVTRAEFMRYVNRAFHFTEKASISYSDVQSNSWYYDTVRIAEKYGYINGTGNGRMNPEGYVTREQAAVILGRLYKANPGNVKPANLSFKDKAKVATWSAGYVKAAVDKGIITGYKDNTFKPAKAITRAELAKILYYYLGTSLSTAGKAYTGSDLKSDTANVTISESCTLSDATIDGDLYLRKPDFMERDLAPLIQPLAEEERPVVVVVNKVDLFHDKSRMLPLLESVAQMFPKAEIFPASALRRNGVEQLLELIRSHLPEGEAQFPEDQLSTAPMKFMAAEIIREKLFEKLYQEVPYSVAVDVEVWDEEDDRVLIHAAIYVAKPSHKAMVIGRAGEGIKAIGTAARKEIRDLVDKKVHLELWVKVREDWVDDPQFLHSLGFGAEAEY